MEPLRGVLDEAFFTKASPECLSALARLVDDALARRFQEYLNSTTIDNPTAVIIRNYLGAAIKSSTFHLELLERGIVEIVSKIELETVADWKVDLNAVIRELDFLEQNFQYVRPYLEPRKKRDYEEFFHLLPASYKARVDANRIMFYQPHARMRATGVAILINKRDIWTIALKGLKFRQYFAKMGYMLDIYSSKEF